MTTTTTETQTEIKVLKSVRQVVDAYVKAEEAYIKADEAKQSKYWPMTFEAIRLIEEEKMDPEDVRDQFNEALRLAHNVKKDEATSVQLSNWRLMSLRILKLARKGKVWIDSHRDAAGNLPGIWKLLDMITEEEASARVEAEAKGKEAEDVARASKRGPAPKEKPSKYKVAAGKTDEPVLVRSGKGRKSLAPVVVEPNLEQEEAHCFTFIVENPERFVKLFDQILEEGKLSPDALETIIEKIQKSLGSKSKASK